MPCLFQCRNMSQKSSTKTLDQVHTSASSPIRSISALLFCTKTHEYQKGYHYRSSLSSPIQIRIRDSSTILPQSQDPPLSPSLSCVSASLRKCIILLLLLILILFIPLIAKPADALSSRQESSGVWLFVRFQSSMFQRTVPTLWKKPTWPPRTWPSNLG